MLNQIAVYTNQTTNSSGFILKAFSANQSGFPVFTDTIFSMQVSNSNFSQGWNFVSVNQLIDTNKFCLVIYPTSQPGETFKIGFSANQSQTNSFWKINSNPNYYSTTEGLLMRAYINVGNNNFQYTSINYNGTSARIYTNLTNITYAPPYSFTIASLSGITDAAIGGSVYRLRQDTVVAGAVVVGTTLSNCFP